MSQSRRSFLRDCACLGAGALLPMKSILAAATSPQPLNILFILADDMSWNGPGCYGNDLHETPNIDRLAREGLRFTQAYAASPVCTPTRASILTGKHPARLNMTVWHESALERRETKGTQPLAAPLTEPNLGLEYQTIAEVLQKKGYQTAHVGKWHLGDAAHYPEAQGFESNIGGTMWGAPRTYWHPYHGERITSEGKREHRYVPDLPYGKEGEYLTDRLTDEAIKVLDRVHGAPFFLHMAYHSPHTPIEGKPDLVAYYEKKRREGMTHTNARYAAMVHSLDENIGRLLDKLEELAIADQTLVIFFSDNGGFDQVRDGEQVTNNSPLRSGKGSLYEGGIREPLIMKWPGLTKPASVCERPVLSTDFFPTLLDAIGMEPGETGCGPLDGLSLRPLLVNPDAALDRDTLCWHYPHYYFTTSPVSAIRHGDWKLLEYYEDGHLELYNLKEDLGEHTDCADSHPDIAANLQHRLHAWRKEVNAQLPEKNDSVKQD